MNLVSAKSDDLVASQRNTGSSCGLSVMSKPVFLLKIQLVLPQKSLTIPRDNLPQLSQHLIS